MPGIHAYDILTSTGLSDTKICDTNDDTVRCEHGAIHACRLVNPGVCIRLLCFAFRRSEDEGNAPCTS